MTLPSFLSILLAITNVHGQQYSCVTSVGAVCSGVTRNCGSGYCAFSCTASFSTACSNAIFNCNSASSCVFNCAGSAGASACAGATFNCNGGSSCSLTCSGSACSGLVIYDAPGSICSGSACGSVTYSTSATPDPTPPPTTASPTTAEPSPIPSRAPTLK